MKIILLLTFYLSLSYLKCHSQIENHNTSDSIIPLSTDTLIEFIPWEAPPPPRLLLDKDSPSIKCATDNGFELIEVEPIPCNSSRSYEEGDTIIYPYPEYKNIVAFDTCLVDSILSVNITIQANCCSDFFAGFNYVPEENLVVLELIEYGNTCDCNCCFGFVYKIKTKQETDKTRYLLKTKSKPIYIYL
ncbi:hypothetical protein ACE1ET_11400 [Saccharicrinis sp. FJH62]|uniref:hypothetical protein n=1 Tax=Saccharicrinis sp. FJH62 TaxID=3344657 RepID=UPI0035D4DF5F